MIHRSHSQDVEAHLAPLASGQWSELERIVERFETAWRSGSAPDLAEYLPSQLALRHAVLCELVAVDLEWRWQGGLAASVEGYFQRFPELSRNSDTIVHLATCELRARQHAGSTVDPAEFLARFPSVIEQLRSALENAAMEDSAAAAHDVDMRPEGVKSDSDTKGRFANVAPAPSSEIGRDLPRRVGRYELVRQIGGGSFGTVYEAVDLELGRRVAVKLPRHAVAQREDERTRFVREAHNLARLSHAAIVPVLDAGWSEGLFYIVCALVEGPTLENRLRGGPLEPRAAAQIIATIADALDHAHQQGIVHRDVKPSNILFDARGQPWLTDFGLSGQRDLEATLTLEGQLLGTPAYMAPEQAAGTAHRPDGRSDVYSLGAVLYECLCGQLPFVGSPSAVLDQIRYCSPLPPGQINPKLDRDLETICLMAMEKHPRDRYQTAAAMAEDLRRYLAGEPTRARPPGPARRLVKWARRKPAVAALVGVTLAATLSVMALVWWHNIQLRDALTQTDAALLASEQSRRQTEDMLYAADVRFATSSLLNGNRLETVNRLSKYIPNGVGPDRREFAWRRLWSQCHADDQTLRGHEGDVYVAQSVGDGQRLVSAGRDGTLRLWDHSRSPQATTLGRYPDELGFAALAPNGVTLATGGDAGVIRLLDLATGRETSHFVGHANWVLCGAISPGGEQLATAGRDNVIRLWSIPGGNLLAELQGHTATVESLAYLPDGKSLVSTGNDRSLRLWDLAANTGSVLATHPNTANYVACSHDGCQVATACADNNVYVWDVATRTLCGSLGGHTDSVQCVAFSPDDTRLASAGVDGTVRVWDLAKSAQLETFLGHASRVWSVAWLPDGRTLASAGGDGTIRLWHLGTSRLERMFTLPIEVGRVCISARDGRIWSPNGKGLPVSDAQATPTGLAAPVDDLRRIESARRADVLAVQSGDRHVRLYDGAGRPLSPLIDLPVAIGQLALSPAGDLLAVRAADGHSLRLYELPTFHLRWSRAVHDHGLGKMEFAQQGDELVVAAGEAVVAEFKAADGAMRVAFRPRLLWRVTASPNGRLLAAGCRDRAVRIWDREQGKELACLQGHDGEVHAIAFSPDGQTLVAGTSAGSLKLWHVASWQELGGFTTSLAGINDVLFSANGETLAIAGRTAGGGGQIVLWQTKDVGDELR